jgi:photosystem II stability/assembly factor-like uncharacterized protein
MAIALSHSGKSVYASSSFSDEILIGTAAGIVSLRRTEHKAGSSWRVAARTLAGSHVSSIIFPNPETVVAAIHFGGVVLSRDGGKTWGHCDNGIEHKNVYSLAATALNGRTRLFAGTEPAHLYLSDDLGQSWSESASLRSGAGVARWTFPAPPHEAHVKVITVAPDDPATIYASIEQGDLLRSDDAGETWHELSGFGDDFDYDVHRLVIHPEDPARLYLMGGLGLWISEDRGEHWQRFTDERSPLGAYPDQLSFVPRHRGVFLASGARGNPFTWMQTGFAGSRIAITRDGARSWEICENGLPGPDKWQSAIEGMTLEEWDPSFSAFVGTTSGEVFATDDGGASWSQIASGLAPISKGLHYVLLNRPS